MVAIMKHAYCLLLLLLPGSSLSAEVKLPDGRDPRAPVMAADLPPLPDEQTVPWGKEVDGLSCRLVIDPEITHGLSWGRRQLVELGKRAELGLADSGFNAVEMRQAHNDTRGEISAL